MYTSKTDSLARRSCQTSLDTLLNILIRLIAPILSYTAEEIWQSSPNLNNQEESVFLSNYFNNHNKGELKISNEEWKRLFEIKDSVNQSIEELRNENKLKGSLDAVVNIEASDSDFTILEKLGTELHFLFISSDAKITKGSSLKITVINSEHDKCTRCWHRDSSVGKNDLYREICQRCIINISEEGEQRSFV